MIDKPYKLHSKARRAYIESAMAHAPTTGYVIECGVASGTSLRWIARSSSPNQKIFGFDSFEGLPEDWTLNEEVTVPKGASAKQPTDIVGVDYRVGLFEDTMPVWKKEHPGRIAFLHVDSDLYSSCVTVLTELNDQIVPGTVILFDEIYGSERYKYWEEGEYKAYVEWKENYDRKTYLLSSTDFCQAAFRVIQ